MASSISKLKIAVGNYIHKKPVTHSQHHSSDKQNIMETCQNTTVSDGKIKKSASFKRTKHNIPSSLIELTIEDKQRLKHNLMMMHLHDYNLLWIYIEKLCFYYWKKNQIKIWCLSIYRYLKRVPSGCLQIYSKIVLNTRQTYLTEKLKIK